MKKLYCDCCTAEIMDEVSSTVNVSYLGVPELDMDLCVVCYDYGVSVLKQVLSHRRTKILDGSLPRTLS